MERNGLWQARCKRDETSNQTVSFPEGMEELNSVFASPPPSASAIIKLIPFQYPVSSGSGSIGMYISLVLFAELGLFKYPAGAVLIYFLLWLNREEKPYGSASIKFDKILRRMGSQAADHTQPRLANFADHSGYSKEVYIHTLDPNHSLFLLLHLGTITAYSLEDNELWLRHLVGMGIQTGLAFYILLVAFHSSDWLPYMISSKNFSNSMLPEPDPGGNYARASKAAEGSNPIFVGVYPSADHLLVHAHLMDVLLLLLLLLLLQVGEREVQEVGLGDHSHLLLGVAVLSSWRYMLLGLSGTQTGRIGSGRVTEQLVLLE
ncbi:hypothetical protein SASPL_103153 [Salvia splendens]|uniref:DUF4220 domain-containing protein n=1 Tax=Salvia splendens TaxID=180675 RepID=A0A8X8YT88_SALSN|nr:hypothetical protein SASPL_103153 [Salvia splendens]